MVILRHTMIIYCIAFENCLIGFSSILNKLILRLQSSGELLGGKKRDNMKDFSSSLLDPESRGFVYDEVDDYEDETDMLALTKARKMMGSKSSSRVRLNSKGIIPLSYPCNVLKIYVQEVNMLPRLLA